MRHKSLRNNRCIMNPESEPNNENPSQAQNPDPYQPSVEPAQSTVQPAAAAPQPTLNTSQPQVTGMPPTPMQPTSPQPFSPTPGTSGKKKKITIIALIAAVIIALLGAGYVSGYYIPNQPDNVYKSGFERTGKAVDNLVSEGLEDKKLETYKNSEVSGTVEVKAAGAEYSGSFNSKYDSKKTDSTATYKNPDQDVNLQVLSSLPDGKVYPDIYFKLSGITGLGLDEFLPQLKNYDDKWISVSSDYLASVIPADIDDEASGQDFTEKDAAELARIVTDKTREYVFTSDTNKAVVEQRSFVGTEELDGDITANHYTVAIHKDNTKKYCKALVESVMSSDSYKKIPGVKADSIDEDKKDAIKDCDESVDKDIKDTDTFDLWVDKKTKLIHKIRVTDENDKGTYLEIGQTYKKGSNVPLFVNVHSDKDKYDAKLTLDVDTEKSITKGSLTFDYNDNEKYTVKAGFEFKPHNGEIKVEKPAGAVSIEDVMKAFNFDPSALSQDIKVEEDNLL